MVKHKSCTYELSNWPIASFSQMFNLNFNLFATRFKTYEPRSRSKVHHGFKKLCLTKISDNPKKNQVHQRQFKSNQIEAKFLVVSKTVTSRESEWTRASNIS